MGGQQWLGFHKAAVSGAHTTAFPGSRSCISACCLYHSHTRRVQHPALQLAAHLKP